MTLVRTLLLLSLLFYPAQLKGAAKESQQPFEQALKASRLGNWVEALTLWNTVVTEAPDDAAAWSNRGNVRLALGDIEGAIRDQDKAIVLDPIAADPHLNRGIAREALQQW